MSLSALKLELETPVAMIVAAAKNGVIGHKQAMPWYLPEELKHFKRTTLGKPLVMGRATFESIGRPLPGRTNIVISRNPDFTHPGIRVVASLEEALRLADNQAIIDGSPEIMVMGGGQVYQQAFPLVARLYLTQIDAEPEGDTWFPEVKAEEWREVSRDTYPAQEGNRYAYQIKCLERIASF